MSMEHDGLIAEFVEVIRPLAQGSRYGIAIGGSRAKRRTDIYSDYDFRLYTDGPIGAAIREIPEWPAFAATMAKWEAAGVRIDGTWPRSIAVMSGVVERWCNGEGVPDDYEWTIWGYQPLTDIFNQTILEDPLGILGGWKARLATYPPKLKHAILSRELSFIRYWRGDYHYRSKVTRGDVVFLAGLTAKLVHSAMEVLFALNETYYPGDGWNLPIAAQLPLVPRNLMERVTAVLYPGPAPESHERQYEALCALIDDVLALAQSSSR
jgi:hypothetical protein